MNRRTFIQAAAIALPLSHATLKASAANADAPPSKDLRRAPALKLGMVSLSLRDLPVSGVITALKQLDIRFVSIHGAHASFEKDSPEKCAAVAKAFRDAGIAVATSSVVNLPNEEKAVRHAFDNARTAGLTLMTCRPAIDALPLVERLVQETGIRLAVHNHGPEDKIYSSPYDTLKAIQPYDARIGLSLDVGHTMRAGVDPAKFIREHSSRIYDVHLKDSMAIPGAMDDIPVEVGRGRVDMKGIIAALVDVKYPGVAAFEYERIGVNPVTGVAESVGFVRGLLAALAN